MRWRLNPKGGAVEASSAKPLMIINDIRPEIKQAIQASIDRFLTGYKLESFSIEPRENFDGDDAIFVDIYYDFNNCAYDPSISGNLRSDIGKRLYELGEFRFAYIGHHFKPGQQVAR